MYTIAIVGQWEIQGPAIEQVISKDPLILKAR